MTSFVNPPPPALARRNTTFFCIGRKASPSSGGLPACCGDYPSSIAPSWPAKAASPTGKTQRPSLFAAAGGQLRRGEAKRHHLA